MEKSSKNLISLFGEKPARGSPKPPPTRESGEFTREMQDADAKLGRGERGRGENNAKLKNSSMEQHFDARFYTNI